MKKECLPFLLATIALLMLSACGGGQEGTEPEVQPEESNPLLVEEPELIEETEDKETYPDIIDLFSSVVPDSEIKVSLRNGKTIHAKIKTQLPSSESAPDGWGDTVTLFGEALSAADEKKEDYSAFAASAEILAEDEVILASGFNGTVQFNKFEERALYGEGKTNPPTISKFEYDQISVGMTLSQVREIVGGDGKLENSIGTAGVTSTVQTYRFLGEKDGSYADILFDDYVVYSKIQLFLE